MAIMTVTNLVALLALARWGVGALRDWEAQRRAGVAEPVFVATDNPHLPGRLPGDVWETPGDGRDWETTAETAGAREALS